MSEKDKLERAIRTLEAQRSALGDTVVDTATAELRGKLAALAALTRDERQLVTVLFADVSGFTALSERLDPEEVQALLGRLWRRLDRAIHAHRGHIDKHIGDAVMAVWGLTGSSSDDAADAVRAGLALLSELDAFRRAEQVELAMRVGINTGLASVSRVESTGEWNVIGDTVNVASRLEHAAEIGSVLIGISTAAHVQDSFELSAIRELELKGKRERVEAMTVLRERAAQSRRSLAGGAPFVGRTGELSRLLDAVASARSVRITGEAGIGKSRLIGEALARLPAPTRLLSLSGRREAREAPLQLLRELLLGLARDDRWAGPLRATLLRQLETTLGSALASEAVAYFALLLGVAETEDEQRLEPLAHRPEQLRGRAEVLLLAHLKALAAARTLLVVVDDLQWVDRASLAFLSSLARAKLPGLALIVAYSEAPGIPLDTDVELPLGPLAYEHALGIAGNADPELSDAIVQRAGGNPFYLLELARWAAARKQGAAHSVPPRVEQLIHERIQRLSPKARTTLGAAAVVGTELSEAELERTLNDTADPLALDELAASGLLGQASPKRRAFESTLSRDVAYDFALLRDRRRWHECFARALATDRVPEAARIARHFLAAGLLADAARWFAASGDQARRADSPETSLEEYRESLRALEAAPPEEPTAARALRLACHEGMGRVFERLAHYGDAIGAFERALDSARAADDRLAQARIYNAMSWSLSQEGRHDAALSAAEQAESFARAVDGDGRGQLAEALHNAGWAAAMLGDTERALGLGQAALEAATSPRESALAHNLIGVVHYHLRGAFPEGELHQTKSLELYRSIGDRWGISCQLNNLGDLARARGDLDAALRFLEDGLAAAREISHRGQELVLMGNLGRVLLGLGDATGAERVLTAAVDLARAGAGSFTLSESLCTLANALAVQGRLADALAAGQAALDEASSPDDLASAWRTLGKLLSTSVAPRGTLVALPELVREGRSIDAEECFARALRGFVELGLEREQIATYEAWARFEDARGAPDRARELRSEARARKRATTRIL